MKALLSLIVLCITLALCQAACFYVGPKGEIRNGMSVVQDSCIDPFDGSKHLSGSQWHTDHCVTCSCSRGAMQCCSRGVAGAPEGCKAVFNYETCEYEFYRTDNPSEPCH